MRASGPVRWATLSGTQLGYRFIALWDEATSGRERLKARKGAADARPVSWQRPSGWSH